MCMITMDFLTTLVVVSKKVSVRKEELINRDLFPEEVNEILDTLKKTNFFMYSLFFSSYNYWTPD